ncbi:MAG TPA: PA2779 family protein [Thermoanaerobaculia bacterium]|nr:PA2779 family protein [Thermoanaerobaculia bacterium]
MHTVRVRHLLLAGFAVLLLAGALTPAQALPAPSKTAPDQTLADREADLATVTGVLEQEEVMAVLAAQGFTREEANLRLAQLAPEELGALANQVEQLQAAGQVPYWIWILVGVLVIVAIVAVA